MALGLENYPDKVLPPNSDYPSGRSINNDGSGQATRVNRETLGDYQQFFAKLLRWAGITPNKLPDNEYSGLQYWEAAKINFQRYQSVYLPITGTLNLKPNDQAVIYCQPGTFIGFTVVLPPINDTQDGHTVRFVNEDASAVITVNADVNIGYGVPPPYSVTSTMIREFTLMKSISCWIVTASTN